MANLVYLTLNGELQGLISAGCSSLDSIGNKAQLPAAANDACSSPVG